MATNIKLGNWAAGIAALIEAQGLDEMQVRQAVDSALGELPLTEEGKTKGTAKIKASKEEDEPDKFILTEKQVNKFSGACSYPLRLYLFNQDLLKLEKQVGQIDLNGWPQWLAKWMSKFAVKS